MRAKMNYRKSQEEHTGIFQTLQLKRHLCFSRDQDPALPFPSAPAPDSHLLRTAALAQAFTLRSPCQPQAPRGTSFCLFNFRIHSSTLNE